MISPCKLISSEASIGLSTQIQSNSIGGVLSKERFVAKDTFQCKNIWHRPLMIKHGPCIIKHTCFFE